MLSARLKIYDGDFAQKFRSDVCRHIRLEVSRIL
jgi:hypothetical protein